MQQSFTDGVNAERRRARGSLGVPGGGGRGKGGCGAH